MSFTTNTFLFVFLPILLAVYFISRAIVKKEMTGNIILILFSIVFYSWAVAMDALFLLIYSLIVYVLGHLISKKGNKGKLVLTVGLIFLIALLAYYKYLPVIATNIQLNYQLPPNRFTEITAPLGISFITFSSITYLVDIYRGDATNGSILDCLLYMFFFPKVISGPIVPWKDFQNQLVQRNITSDRFISGFNRIALGFAKKVIIANTLAPYESTLLNKPIDTVSAWFGLILYAMQLYYDFSGYSDIAIGLAKIFGFDFEENFNFPYLSTSVTEFWRRWHISLGAFFRNYLYIPLGGNRKGYKRTLINLGIVFIVTGMWHGTGLAYIGWGCIHGFCVIFERIVRNKTWYKKIPTVVKWAVTFFICTMAWEFFRCTSLMSTLTEFGKMFGITSYERENWPWYSYIDTKCIFYLTVAIIGSLLPGTQRVLSMYNSLKDKYWFYILQEVVLYALFILSIIYMMTSTFSPFIYFQF